MRSCSIIHLVIRSTTATVLLQKSPTYSALYKKNSNILLYLRGSVDLKFQRLILIRRHLIKVLISDMLPTYISLVDILSFEYWHVYINIYVNHYHIYYCIKYSLDINNEIIICWQKLDINIAYNNNMYLVQNMSYIDKDSLVIVFIKKK